MLSVVIPCYNEALNIPHICKAFKECMGDRKDVEILLVNNGSKDNSAQVLEEELKQDASNLFRIVTVKENKGYGFGILSGLKEAKGEVLAWTHADLQTDPGDVLTAYKAYLKHNDPQVFVKGTRRNRQFHAWLFSWGMQIIASVVLKESLKEINAQPKVFSRSFYNKHLHQGAPYDFSLDLYVCYWATKAGKIVEIPVLVNKRKFGEAKGGGSVRTKIKLIARTFRYIMKFRNELNEESKIRQGKKSIVSY